MTLIRILRSMVVIGLCLGWASSSSAATPGIRLTQCTMIDGRGGEPVTNAIILVKDGIIEYAGTAEGAKITEGYREINLRGATVLPGFINAHVHRALEKENLRSWLKAGVTSVRDLGSRQPARERIEMRNDCAADPSCARVFISTPSIAREGGYGHFKYSSEQDLRAKLNRVLTAGFDLVKTSVEDDCQGRKWDLISLEELQLICREAHEKGIRVSAHISWVRNIDLALQGGVDFLEHMVFDKLDRTTAEKVARRGIYWIPTLELYKRIGESRGSSWHLNQPLLNLKLYNEVGGLIALGTDFAGYNASFDNGFPITEVKLMLSAGLTPMQIIVAGTKNAAMVCGQGAQNIGTLEQGKWADIIAVDGNPLKDVEILQKVSFVMKDGEVVLMQ